MKINKKPIYFFSLIIIFSIFLKIIGKNYTINMSHSLPRGIYRLEPATTLQKGDIVYFKIPPSVKNILKERQYTLSVVNSFIKKIAAEEGDRISIKENIFYVNDISWGLIFNADPQNKVLPKLTVEELTPKKGELLPLTNALYSFDGRYFGTIKKSDVKYKCKLIFKF